MEKGHGKRKVVCILDRMVGQFCAKLSDSEYRRTATYITKCRVL